MKTPKDEIQQVIDRYLAAYEAQDAKKCASYYSENAVIISPYGPPCIGRDAIRAEHAQWFEEDETNKTMKVLSASISGDLGNCLVAYSADYPSDDGTTRMHGASLSTLQKDNAAGWLFQQSCLNELEHDLTQALT